MSSFSTSHYKIFDYWKDKCISEDGGVHIEGEYDYSKSIAVVEDWGEPTCWGCGKPIKVEDEELYDKWIENEDLTKIWNCKTLKRTMERCHIKAKALNGNDNPDNLFLLCKRCHKESPDTYNKRMFFKWIYTRRLEGYPPFREMNHAKQILKNDYSIKIPIFTGDA